MKKQNGITLVALVITIIVLLILAAVSINAIMGDDGIVNQTINASVKEKESQAVEQVSLALTSLKIDYTMAKKEDSTLQVENYYTAEKLNEYLKDGEIQKLEYGPDGTATLVYKVSENEVYTYVIDNKGKIIEDENDIIPEQKEIVEVATIEEFKTVIQNGKCANITNDITITAADGWTVSRTVDVMSETGKILIFENNASINGDAIIKVNGVNIQVAGSFIINGNVTFKAQNGEKMTFVDGGSIKGKGKVTIDGINLETLKEFSVRQNVEAIFKGGEHNFNAFSCGGNGIINVSGATINCKDQYASIGGVCLVENGSLIINSGTVNLYGPINLNKDLCDKVYVEINGGTINVDSQLDKIFIVRNILEKDNTSGILRGSYIKITGGTINAPYEFDDTGDGIALIRNEDSYDTMQVLISNTYNGNPDYNCVITGGKFIGDWRRNIKDYGNVDNTVAGFVDSAYEVVGDSTTAFEIKAK